MFGFGGDGNPDGPPTVPFGSCVADGPFAADYEVLFYDFLPRPRCLSRGFGRFWGKPFSGDYFQPSAIEYVIAEATFYNFTRAIEDGPHNAVPNQVGGDFWSSEAPNGQPFYLAGLQNSHGEC